MSMEREGDGMRRDLISRKDALSLLTVFTEKDALGSTPAEIIKHMPSVDPVVHGHWIKVCNQDWIQNMKCSICGGEIYGDVDTEKYCFNCGAKMR